MTQPRRGMERLAREHVETMGGLAREHAETVKRQTNVHRAEVMRKLNAVQTQTHAVARGSAFPGHAKGKCLIRTAEGANGAREFQLRLAQRRRVSHVFSNDPVLHRATLTSNAVTLRTFVTEGLEELLSKGIICAAKC